MGVLVRIEPHVSAHVSAKVHVSRFLKSTCILQVSQWALLRCLIMSFSDRSRRGASTSERGRGMSSSGRGRGRGTTPNTVSIFSVSTTPLVTCTEYVFSFRHPIGHTRSIFSVPAILLVTRTWSSARNCLKLLGFRWCAIIERPVLKSFVPLERCGCACPLRRFSRLLRFKTILHALWVWNRPCDDQSLNPWRAYP
jgi:hypothetical protein